VRGPGGVRGPWQRPCPGRRHQRHRPATGAEFCSRAAGKGAEFALGRDRYWDSVLIFVLSLATLILVSVGGQTLYGRRKRAIDPEDTAAGEEREPAGAE
jgi:hypothetical protein